MSQPHPQGYLALPGTGKGPGVLVLHPWWGLNDTMKALCGRLAAEGFIAFAPDLYHGKVATSIEDAENLRRQLNNKQAKADIADAVAYIEELVDANRPGLGVIGFSLGAYYALGLSLEAPKHLRAVVVFYGTRSGDYKASRAAYLGHYAETDEWVPASGIKRLERALRAAGRPETFHTYEGTGHWFFEQDRSGAYKEAAAHSAWERTLAFLRHELSS